MYSCFAQVVSAYYLHAKHWLYWYTESFKSSGKMTLVLSFQQRYLLTHSYYIVFLYYPGCINILPTCQTLITLITLITESVISSRKIALTLSFQQHNLTYSYGIVFLQFPGCINILPMCQTLITLITLITESFVSSPKLTLAAIGGLQLASTASHLAVGTSKKSAHTTMESKKAKKSTKKNSSMTDIWTTPLSTNLLSRQISKIL